jgi:Flp pilus assembly protein TadG
MAVIEAAILFPILVLIVLGMLEYGFLFIKLQGINNAAREGVRVAVREGATTGQVDAAITQAMTNGGMSTFSRTLPNVGAAPGTEITCTVTVQYTNIDIVHVLTTFLPHPTSLTGTASMLKEGPL